MVVVVAIAGWYAYVSIPSPLTAKKPKVIGAVYIRQNIDSFKGLKEGMVKLGYTDADIVYDEFLFAPGPTFPQDVERGVKKMIDDNVDILFVSMEHMAQTALQFTKESGKNIPIVFMSRFHDPIGFGIINSYKSSGNNATGVATSIPEVVQKVLSFFKEINPKAKRIGIFGQGFMVPGFGDAILAEAKNQAPRLGLAIVEYTTTNPPTDAKKNWYEVADKIKPGDIDGIFHLPGHFYDPQETDEMILARRLHIPHHVPLEDMPTGGTFGFSDNVYTSAEQVSVMVDKIFKGATPSNIPIEYGAKNILVLNLKRAIEAGFSFPPSMLSIAETKIDK